MRGRRRERWSGLQRRRWRNPWGHQHRARRRLSHRHLLRWLRCLHLLRRQSRRVWPPPDLRRPPCLLLPPQQLRLGQRRPPRWR
jgi:hypothetical protein